MFRHGGNPDVKFSLDTSDYDPRCSRCHSRYDRQPIIKQP